MKFQGYILNPPIEDDFVGTVVALIPQRAIGGHDVPDNPEELDWWEFGWPAKIERVLEDGIVIERLVPDDSFVSGTMLDVGLRDEWMYRVRRKTTSWPEEEGVVE